MATFTPGCMYTRVRLAAGLELGQSLLNNVTWWGKPQYNGGCESKGERVGQAGVARTSCFSCHYPS